MSRLTIAVLVVLAGCKREPPPSPPPPVPPESPQKPVQPPSEGKASSGSTVQVFDAKTAKPLANRKLRVRSENGVRCAVAPCPVVSNTTEITSDAEGRIVIPGGLEAMTSVEAEGYIGRDLKDALDIDGHWVIDIDDDATANGFLRRYKLIDSGTMRPLVGVEVTVSGCGVVGTTNALGNVYYRGCSGTVSTPGYAPVQISAGWVNYRAIMVKQ